MMKRFSKLPLLFVFLLSACSYGVIDPPAGDTPLNRDSAAAFQTESLSYTLVPTAQGLEGEIAFIFTNPTAEPVYIVNCRGMTALRLEKQSGDTWITAWSPVILQCLSPPIVVQPGQQYSGVVHVSSGYPSTNLHPQFSVDPIPGVYRIVWDDVLRTYDDGTYPFGEPIPHEQRVSNRFRLLVASR